MFELIIKKTADIEYKSTLTITYINYVTCSSFFEADTRQNVILFWE